MGVVSEDQNQIAILEGMDKTLIMDVMSKVEPIVNDMSMFARRTRNVGRERRDRKVEDFRDSSAEREENIDDPSRDLRRSVKGL